MTERVEIAAIHPEPDDDEVAAIVSALEMLWPDLSSVPEEPNEPARWRFSGRWWTKPAPLRRDRPW
jgi:hypothetical protein